MISTEISADVAALVDALKSVPVGSTISYAEMTAAIGRKITDHRHLIHSALRIVARDHGAVFANDRGAGYTRLDTASLPNVGVAARGRIRRKARSAAKTIKYGMSRANDVSPETQRKVNAELSVLGLVEHLSRDDKAEPADAHSLRPEPVAIVAQRLLGAMA